MFRIVLSMALLLAGVLFCPKNVYAVTVSIIDYPSTISLDQFSLTASVSEASSGTNYLRLDIFKDGTTTYFGETYNGSDWYSGSDGKQYFPITVEIGRASCRERVKIAKCDVVV